MTLLVAMIMLIMLMLLGLSAMQASNTMIRLAGNLQFQNEAMNRAEIALIAGENLLKSSTIWPTNCSQSTNTPFLTPGAATNNLPLYDPTATLNPQTNWPSVTSAVDAAQTEQFFIQLISKNAVVPLGYSDQIGRQATTQSHSYYLFRVTARGRTMRGAVRYVESILQVPACPQ